MLESKLKQFISNELNLPIECIYEDVQLITLYILSNYLKNLSDSEKYLLTINFSKLTVDIENYSEIERNKIRINISCLFNKKNIKKIYYYDSFGEDGFCEANIETALFLFKIEEFTGISIITKMPNIELNTIGQILSVYERIN